MASETRRQPPEDGSPAPSRPRVVVFEPDAHASRAVLRHLEALGVSAIAVRELRSVADAVRRYAACIVVADLADDSRRLQALLSDLADLHPRPALVAVATHLSATRAVRWMRGGVDDLVFKPLRACEFKGAIERALAAETLRQPEHLQQPLPERVTRDRSHGEAALTALVGDDPRLRRALELARAASRVRSTVLIQGETGTGKSTLARAIHLASPRHAAPFVELACGSVPESLLESELFGHVKGAFTGALADKKGRFLAADGGTIFLDEINAATPQMQVKLLRVLQERAFEPVGSDQTIEVDVRVVVAANTPLEQLVEQGRFSPDLFYRVHVLQIDLPPLRERMRDLERLANHFLGSKAAEFGRALRGFSAEAFDALLRHAWPGNVRELEHAIERAVILSDGEWVEASALPERVQQTCAHAKDPCAQAHRHDDCAPRGGASIEPLRLHHGADRAECVDIGSARRAEAPAPRSMDRESLAQSMRAPERAALIAALEAAAWNRSRAARSLGIDRSTLYRKMRDLGLHRGRAAG